MPPKDIIQRKLATLFPDRADREQANAELVGYGVAPCEREPERVRLAVLKLAGADLDKLRSTIRQAREDYRDILAWAEYPRQSQRRPLPDGPEKRRLIAEDRAEYENWLRA